MVNLLILLIIGVGFFFVTEKAAYSILFNFFLVLK